MKERPILFSAPMVRAILDGSKTQTRRVVKPQPKMYEPGMDVGLSDYTADMLICPHGRLGDRLWVRESFWGCDMPGYGDIPCVVYDDEWEGKEYKPAEARPWARKFGRIPSIHMPRDASRILLEITSVRVERLNSISENDVFAEGIEKLEDHSWEASGARPLGTFKGLDEWSDEEPYWVRPKDAFLALWEHINGAGSWDTNPWVWVVEFKRVKP